MARAPCIETAKNPLDDYKHLYKELCALDDEMETTCLSQLLGNFDGKEHRAES